MEKIVHGHEQKDSILSGHQFFQLDLWSIKLQSKAWQFIVDVDKLILSLYGEKNDPEQSTQIKEEQNQRIDVSDFKTFYKVTVRQCDICKRIDKQIDGTIQKAFDKGPQALPG